VRNGAGVYEMRCRDLRPLARVTLSPVPLGKAVGGGAGLEPERQDREAGLADIFPGMGEGLAERIVTAPGVAQMMLHSPD
jgi:hypothetical protein